MAKQLFYYKGRDIKGDAVSGKLEADNINDIIIYLKKDNITPINIQPITRNPFNLQKLLSFNIGEDKVEPYHVMNFCRQLGLLNNTGIPLIKALRKLAESAISKKLQSILNIATNDISAGMNLSAALKKHPSAFSPLIVNIIEVGENTGNLSEVLIHLSKYIETTIANRRRLVSSIRYPTFVLATAVLAIFAMSFFVIPRFATLFSSFGAELPLATRILIGFSNFIVNNKIAILISFIVTFFGIKRLVKIPGIRYVWDKYKLHLPVFGKLQRRIVVSQFTWGFGLILRAGIPIIKGIALASQSTNNVYFQSQLLKMSEDIEHGENLSRAAITSGLFTPITIQMIEVGEESEKLDESLSEISEYYDAEIDYDLKKMGELIEPVLLGIIGIIVVIMALGIYFPMWDLIQVVRT